MKKIVLLAVIQSLIFSAPLYAWELPWEKNKRIAQENRERATAWREENTVMTDSLLAPCKSSIRGISRNPATLQIALDSMVKMRMYNGFNDDGIGYTKTEGGYVLDLDVTDSDGSYNINCYLNDGKRVIDLQKHY